MYLRHISAALLVCCSLAPRLALAQAPASDADVATARKLAIDGLSALEQRDFVRAETLFSNADALFHAPTITLGLARARAGLGKLVGAQEAYSRVIHTTIPADASPVFVKAIEDARRELEALTPRVPSVIIQVKGSSTPRVTLDGVEVPRAALGAQRPADPGKHVVRAAAPGCANGEATVTLAEGRTETVTLVLTPGQSTPLGTSASDATATGGDAGAAAASPVKPIGFAAVGVGAAGLVVGAVTGAIGLAKQTDLLNHCPNAICPSNTVAMYGSEVNMYQAMKAVSAAGLAAGGAFAVTGVILLVTAPRANAPAATITPVVGPGYIGAQGRF